MKISGAFSVYREPLFLHIVSLYARWRGILQHREHKE